MNNMRKLMETVEQFVDEERTTDASTVKVLGKTKMSLSAEYAGNDSDGEGYAARILNLEVREYKNNKFADDGVYVYISEDGYDGFNLEFTLEDFKKLVNAIGKLFNRG